MCWLYLHNNNNNNNYIVRWIRSQKYSEGCYLELVVWDIKYSLIWLCSAIFSFIFTCRYGCLHCEYCRLYMCVCVCVCVCICICIHTQLFLASNVASMGPCTGSLSGSVTSYLGIRRSVYSFTIFWGAANSISSLVDAWVRAAKSSRTASYCFAGILAI